MKYAIILILILISVLICTIIVLKNNSKNKTIIPNIKPKTPIYKETKDDNYNPSFEVELIDYKKNQLNISKSHLNDEVHFKKDKDKRIKVYTTSKLYIGKIAIKDYKNFDLIAKKPYYFEGVIYSYLKEDITAKKVIISIQAKIEYSKEIYKINNDYLNKLVTLNSIFEVNQIIQTSYGASTIIEIHEDHLIVDVPSLGKREIYNLKETIN